MQLRNAVAIITGAAGGFGLAFAERILSSGGRVFITDIKAKKLAATGEKLVATFGKENIAWSYQDITEPESFERVFREAVTFFGRAVNLLVNNAGISGDGTFWKDSLPHSWEKVITVDLTALIRGAQVGIHHMKENLNGEEGVVINVSSFAGIQPAIFGPEYCAAKHGVVGFTRACFPLKQEANVRVVCLAPAFANTAMGRAAARFIPEIVKLAGGVMELDKVVASFDLALEDETNAGRVISLMPSEMAYHDFANEIRLYPGSASKL